MTNCMDTTHMGEPCGPDCIWQRRGDFPEPEIVRYVGHERDCPCQCCKSWRAAIPVPSDDERECGCRSTWVCSECTSPDDYETADA